MHSTLGRLAGALAGLGAAVVGAALLEARAYRVVRHDVALPPKPGAAPFQCRILHISDTHYARGQRAKARFLSSLERLDPDVIVFTGDMVADDDSFDEFLEAIAGLLHLPGVFVRGSNDYFAPSMVNPFSYLVPRSGRRLPTRPRLKWRRLRDALVAAGWHDVNNSHASLTLDGQAVNFVGTGDAHLGWDHCECLAASINETTLSIGVTHAPYRRVLAAMAKNGVPLVLAGHTHGGQICLPGVGALVTNCDLPPSLAKGLFRWPDDDRGAEEAGPPNIVLHVTGGVGTSPQFPLRTFCRPEVCLLDVHRAISWG